MQPARIMMRKTQIRFMWLGGIVTYKCFAAVWLCVQGNSKCNNIESEEILKLVT